MKDTIGENKEEYLEAIYSLLEEGKEATQTEIAKKLKIKTPSVTEMLKKLSAEGYITTQPYKPTTLTEKGYQTAAKIKRKHRLLERFLHDILQIKNKIHDQACEMEHKISDEATESIEKLMNYPKTCPDNKPIPSAEDAIKPKNLLDLKEGDTAVIAYLDGGEGFKEKIRSLGIREGKTLKIIAKEPFGGPIVVKTDNTQITIGRGMASKIKVLSK